MAKTKALTPAEKKSAIASYKKELKAQAEIKKGIDAETKSAAAGLKKVKKDADTAINEANKIAGAKRKEVLTALSAVQKTHDAVVARATKAYTAATAQEEKLKEKIAELEAAAAEPAVVM